MLVRNWSNSICNLMPRTLRAHLRVGNCRLWYLDSLLTPPGTTMAHYSLLTTHYSHCTQYSLLVTTHNLQSH